MDEYRISSEAMGQLEVYKTMVSNIILSKALEMPSIRQKEGVPRITSRQIKEVGEEILRKINEKN